MMNATPSNGSFRMQQPPLNGSFRMQQPLLNGSFRMQQPQQVVYSPQLAPQPYQQVQSPPLTVYRSAELPLIQQRPVILQQAQPVLVQQVQPQPVLVQQAQPQTVWVQQQQVQPTRIEYVQQRPMSPIQRPIQMPMSPVQRPVKVISPAPTVQIPIMQERQIETREVVKQVQVPVEKRVEVPIEKIVEKIVYKDREVPVEKRVEFPVEKIKEVPIERPGNQREVQVPVEKVVYMEREVPVEMRVEVPVERMVMHEMPMMERVVEVPVERRTKEVRYEYKEPEPAPDSEPQIRPVGLGILLVRPQTDEGLYAPVYMREIVPGFAAYNSGQLQLDDVLETIDGRQVPGMELPAVKKLTFGAEGTLCNLEVRRGDSTFPVTVLRVDAVVNSSNQHAHNLITSGSLDPSTTPRASKDKKPARSSNPTYAPDPAPAPRPETRAYYDYVDAPAEETYARPVYRESVPRRGSFRESVSYNDSYPVRYVEPRASVGYADSAPVRYGSPSIRYVDPAPVRYVDQAAVRYVEAGPVRYVDSPKLRYMDAAAPRYSQPVRVSTSYDSVPYGAYNGSSAIANYMDRQPVARDPPTAAGDNTVQSMQM